MLFVRVVSLIGILEMECLSKFKAMLKNSIGINMLSERGHLFGMVAWLDLSTGLFSEKSRLTRPNNARSPFQYKISTYRFFKKRAFLIHTENILDNQLDNIRRISRGNGFKVQVINKLIVDSINQ